MAYRRPESALVVIYDDNHNVLVLQRQDDPGFWQSVTGTLELDEQPVETAIREVFEETGIDIHTSGYQIIDHRVTNQFMIRDIWRHRYPPECQYNTEYVFSLCVSAAQSITLTEHLQYEWLDKQAAVQRVWSDTNKKAIALCVPENTGK